MEIEKNLENFQSIPEIFSKETIFEQAFVKAEIAKLNNMENEDYERSLKDYRDMKGYVETAFDDGKKAGILEGKKATAKEMKAMGMEISIISKVTGFTDEEISEL